MNVTPCKKYWIPILRIIVQHGGSAPLELIYEHLTRDMKNTRRPGDFHKNGNDPVWKNHARNARESMVKEGLLLRSGTDSPRAVWVITEEGRAFLEEHEQPIEKLRLAQELLRSSWSQSLSEKKTLNELLEGIVFDHSELDRNIGNIDYFFEQALCDIETELEKLTI